MKIPAGVDSGDRIRLTGEGESGPNGGAAGVDMGRNIFQSDAPTAMIQAVRAVVHENMKPEEAHELFQTLKQQKQGADVGV